MNWNLYMNFVAAIVAILNPIGILPVWIQSFLMFLPGFSGSLSPPLPFSLLWKGWGLFSPLCCRGIPLWRMVEWKKASDGSIIFRACLIRSRFHDFRLDAKVQYEELHAISPCANASTQEIEIFIEKPLSS